MQRETHLDNRYYFQRYAYFSKFDQGILMDKGI